MRTTDRVARGAAAVALAGAGVLALAAPAAAAGADSVTIDHAASLTIHSPQSLSLDAVAQPTCKVGVSRRTIALVLSGPSNNAPTSNTLRSTSTICAKGATFSTSMSAPARNGSYLVILSNGASRTASASLNVLIPPVRGRGLAVSTSATTATFSWEANPEADVTSYQITTPSGDVITTAGAGAACSGSSCSTSVDLGPSAAGTTQQFSVRAVRCGLSCNDDLTGASSPAATAQFAAAPAPSPTSSQPGHGGNGGSGGTTGGGTGSTGSGPGSSGGTGGSGDTGHGGSEGVTGHHGRLPGVQAGTLPTLNAPQLAGVRTVTKPLSLGKPGGKIPYPAPSLATATTSTPRSTTQALTHDLTTGLHVSPLWRGIAAAAILLLLALHLRTWVQRVERLDLH